MKCERESNAFFEWLIQSATCCEQGDEPSGPISGRGGGGNVSSGDRVLLKRDSVPSGCCSAAVRWRIDR